LGVCAAVDGTLFVVDTPRDEIRGGHVQAQLGAIDGEGPHCNH
jgi:hypothetical protein